MARDGYDREVSRRDSSEKQGKQAVLDADACGAIGCTTNDQLVRVKTGGRERVLCEFHAQSFQEGHA